MRQQREQDIYASAPLQRLRDEQTRAVAADLQRCFGTHALLLSATADDMPPVLPLLGCWTRLQVGDGHYRGDLQAAVGEPLPFIDEAFDLVLLRHALEVAPPALLVDAVRVLAPAGVLVVTGVHPVSGWAPWLRWQMRGRPLALQLPLRLGYRLRQAGLDVERVDRVGCIWPTATPPATSTSACGGGYVVVARKRRHLAIPLRLKQVPLRVVPTNGRLSPGTRRSSTSS
jgi:SAM-dependent methyltransferase